MDDIPEDVIETEAQRQDDIDAGHEEIRIVEEMIKDAELDLSHCRRNHYIWTDDLNDEQEKEMADFKMKQESNKTEANKDEQANELQQFLIKQQTAKNKLQTTMDNQMTACLERLQSLKDQIQTVLGEIQALKDRGLEVVGEKYE